MKNKNAKGKWMAHNLLIAAVSVLLFTHLSVAQWDCGGVIYPAIPQSITCSNNSPDWLNTYRYQSSYVVGEPLNPGALKTIKIAVHIWQDDYGGNNFPQNQQTEDYINDAIDNLNGGMWSFNDSPTEVLPGVPFISDTKLRVDFKGVTYHQNSTLNNMLLSGNVAQLSAEAILQNPEMEEYMLLHFVCPTCHYLSDQGIAGVASGTPLGSFGSVHYVATKGNMNPGTYNSWALVV